MATRAQDIVLITAPEVLAIPIQECGEPMIDIKQVDALSYGPPPETPETDPDYTRMRQAVFDKLLLAQQNLPAGLRFRLYEGYRSLRVQQMLFDNIYQQTRARMTGATEQEIFNEATRLVSPVINFDGSENVPAHNTGGAVDIQVIDSNGDSVDMGMTADDWCNVNPALCQTDSDLISPEAQQNRQMLLHVMQAQGFVNYPTEWWHFSYGDRYWAYHAKAQCAIYGSACALE